MTGPAALLLVAGCASAGGPGVPPPNLVGPYELSGSLTKDGADPGVPYIVTFLSNRMYEYEQVGQVGESPPPQRYRLSGDYLVFQVEGVEVRVWRRADGNLAAEARGTYVVSVREERYCALTRPDENGRLVCTQYGVREIPTTSTYTRPLQIRKIQSSG